MRRLTVALSAALTALGGLVPAPVSAARASERPDIVNGFCVAAIRASDSEKLDGLAASLGGRFEEENTIIETRVPGGPLPRTARSYRFADGATATYQWDEAYTYGACSAVLPLVTSADLDAREFKVRSGYDGWGGAMPWIPASDFCEGGHALAITDERNVALCASIDSAQIEGRPTSIVDIRYTFRWTDTYALVPPMLSGICSKTVAEAEEPVFVERMSRSGFVFGGDTFSRDAEDASISVMLTGVGCAFRFEGRADVIAQIDSRLQRWASDRGLTEQVSDQNVSGEEGRRISRERSASGKGFVNWQVIDDFNGRERPSRIEGVYSRHAH